MPTKHRQQAEQEKRLQQSIRQAKSDKAENKAAPEKNGGIMAKLLILLGSFLSALLARFFGRSDRPQTVQQTIPYKQMYRDGVCRVSDRVYSKTIAFNDITYQLAQNDTKTQIFEGYCDWLNYFDSSISLQLSFINQQGDLEQFKRAIDIPNVPDDFNSVRWEYAGVIKSQFAKGNNGLVKAKYATFCVEADSLKEAKMRLERIEADVINNFKVLGVTAHSLNGKERLEVLHGIFHPAGSEKFIFDWKELAKTGGSTKDYICPSSFDFCDGKTFRMGATVGAASFIQIIAPELSDRMLADFLDMDSAVMVNMHIRSIDQTAAIKAVKRKLSDLDAMRIQEQKKAVRGGWDMEVLPPDLVTYGKEAQNLLTDLQSRNERMFLCTIIVVNTAQSKPKMEAGVIAAAGIAQKYNCSLKRLEWQQEQAFMSSLPLGYNGIEIQRGLTTSSTAVFVPFTTSELFQSGDALYYGVNALSNNLIMADRKQLRNPNSIILGTPGSGKSFTAKREMVNVFLITQDDIIIADPESEYFPLVERLGGQVIKLSPTSAHYLNPLDINPDYSDEEDPLTLKSDFILSLMELIIGGKDGLQPVERTVIDRCTRLVYRDYLAAPSPEKMPILGDLYELLRAQPEPEAQRVAVALEIYVTGSLNIFNRHTNVDLTNRLVCYDLKELGKGLKKIAMLILQDSVWNCVTAFFQPLPISYNP